MTVVLPKSSYPLTLLRTSELGETELLPVFPYSCRKNSQEQDRDGEEGDAEFECRPPWIDDEQNIYPIYSRKKKRPASSISEVLEEIMDRRNRSKDNDDTTPAIQEPDHNIDNLTEGSAESKLARSSNTDFDPNTGKALSTLDEYEEYLDKVLNTESNSVCSAMRSEADSFTSHGRLSTNEHNGDSGYEASSKPEGEDENENTADITADTISPDTPEQKTNIYDSTYDHGIPVEMTNSKQKLLQNSELSV